VALCDTYPLREDGKITVFLLDDHEVVRRGVHELLSVEDDIEVVGKAGTAADALVRIPATCPDVAVLDVRLPDGSGVEVCREIRSQNEDIRLEMQRRSQAGYHAAGAGSMVAYGADNLSLVRPGSRSPSRSSPPDGLWSVQIVGMCEAVEPGAAELERFGPAPRSPDGAPFDPAHLRVELQFVTVHSTAGGPERHFEHVL